MEYDDAVKLADEFNANNSSDRKAVVVEQLKGKKKVSCGFNVRFHKSDDPSSIVDGKYEFVVVKG